MDRYQRVERPKHESPISENEIRITTQGLIRNYVGYATSLLQEKRMKEIVVKAMGQAISKSVAIAEIIKKTIPRLHQDTAISSVTITDVWEPIEEGLEPVEMTRHVSMISITLSTRDIDKSSAGYQAPLNAEQPKRQYHQQQQQPRQALVPYNAYNEESYGHGRGRGGYGRGRGRAQSWRGGYRNYQGGRNYHGGNDEGGNYGGDYEAGNYRGGNYEGGNNGGDYEAGNNHGGNYEGGSYRDRNYEGGKYRGRNYEGGYRGANYQGGNNQDGYYNDTNYNGGYSNRGRGGRGRGWGYGGAGYERGRGGGGRGYSRGRGRTGGRSRGGGRGGEW